MHHAFLLALMQHDFLLARIRLTRTAAERGPVLSGPAARDRVEASRFLAGALLHHAFVLARIRLTRTAAERGPVLSGECGQMGVFRDPWLPT